MLAVSWRFAIGLPKIVQHRSPNAGHVGDEPLVLWVALRSVLGQVVLEKLEELCPVCVAHPHHRRLGTVALLRSHAQQHPLGPSSSPVPAQAFQRVEPKRETKAALNSQHHPECFELADVDLLADLVLLGKSVQGVLLDSLPVITPGHDTRLLSASPAATELLVF